MRKMALTACQLVAPRSAILRTLRGGTIILACIVNVPSPATAADRLVVAQAMIPPTGTGDAQKPMPMEERMHRRFPQPVRVGDLIGLPVLDDNDSTIGFVREVVRTPEGKVRLIVSYSRWFGWFGRPVAVPIEAVVILGRQLASVDMQPSEYAAAPTWQANDAHILPNDEKVLVGLGRR
jgi:PRC-barrel domain